MNKQELVTDCEWTAEDLQQKLQELNKKTCNPRFGTIYNRRVLG